MVEKLLGHSIWISIEYNYIYKNESNWWNIVLNQIRRVEVSGLDGVVVFNNPFNI